MPDLQATRETHHVDPLDLQLDLKSPETSTFCHDREIHEPVCSDHRKMPAPITAGSRTGNWRNWACVVMRAAPALSIAA